jgi:hypothetical protein
MGYSFTFGPPSDYAVSGCAFNNWQMNYVRLVLVEAGVITGNGLLGFFDDAPSGTEVRGWVEEFAAFNELAASRDGYYVC